MFERDRALLVLAEVGNNLIKAFVQARLQDGIRRWQAHPLAGDGGILGGIGRLAGWSGEGARWKA